MAKSKLVKVNEKIAEKVVGSYEAIENGTVRGYQAIESKVQSMIQFSDCLAA